jgi:Asp-tRNA(Asn)/Glu-tRNA(Gln) amidotransferase B subunit
VPDLSITEFLLAIIRVYRDYKDDFTKCHDDPTHVNFLVGKVLQETKGTASPELAMKTIKAIVKDMESQKLKGLKP